MQAIPETVRRKINASQKQWIERSIPGKGGNYNPDEAV